LGQLAAGQYTLAIGLCAAEPSPPRSTRAFFGCDQAEQHFVRHFGNGSEYSM
jgi:hypothetical protein